MKLHYSYHSEHHASPFDRWRHFLLYLCALLLVYAGSSALYYHFTHWEGGEDERQWWQLLLGIVYLLTGGLLAYLAYRHETHRHTDLTERFVHIDDTHLEWNLEQNEEIHRVALADVIAAERTNIRDLVLEREDGSRVIFPIYLVVGNEKQEDLIRVLVERART